MRPGLTEVRWIWIVMFNLFLLDPKYSFWKKLVQTGKIWFRWNLVPTQIHTCWIRCWCSFVLFWTWNNFFRGNLVYKIKTVQDECWTNKFSLLGRKYLFWANLIQTSKIVWLRWNLVFTLIQICWIWWWCSFVLLWTWDILFRQTWSKKIKTVCLS